MTTRRHCSRPGCDRIAVATMTYAYAESTVVVRPLAAASSPHSWDLCERHAERITAPVGWELVRVDRVEIDDEDDLTALAEAVAEQGRSRGLVSSPSVDASEQERALDPRTSRHPVYRTKRVAEERRRRRSHLRVVRGGGDED
ncbi:DUF3499 domain-containing protein [Corynebacterium otitidis]|uniref:DUF3499 domain-containing protein n=1 Tax=Corynebacterium otitidis TaxID=29321 RepID=UPI00031229E6|nr:DUF3499 domain-containing protein [Corynebacterium otitidis]